MADKVQNVFVNFKFNTAELEKATQLTNRANDASNRLQQNAQNAGKKLSDSFRQPIQSIESMRVQLAKLKASLDLAVDPKKVQELSKQYRDLKRRLDETSKAAYDTSKSFDSIGTAISAAFSAAAIRQVVDTSLELAKLSGNVEGVERAFNRAFRDAPFLLNELRQATQGTVTDFELMQRTLQATNLGLSVEPLPKLFAFAAARAQQTGESVDYLVDSIVRGIGLKSVLRLDNLGLSATRLKEELGGVAVRAASVAEVTAAVGRIADVELKKMGGLARTAATDVDRITVAFHELKVAAGDAFVDINKEFEKSTGLPGFVRSIELAIEGAKALVKARGDITKFGEILLDQEQKTIALQDAARVKEKSNSKEFLADQQKRLDFIQQEINSRVQIINTYQEELRNNRDRLDLLRKSTEGGLSLIRQAELFNRQNEVVNHTIGNTNILNTKGKKLRTELVDLAGKEIPKVEATNEALQSNVTILQETIKLLYTYIQTVGAVTGDEKEQLGIIEAKRDEIEAIQEAIEKTRKSSDLSSRLGVGKLITDLAVAQAELKELLEGPETKEFKINTKPIKDATKEFEKLLNLVKDINIGGIVIKPVKVSLEENEVSVEDPILVRARELKIVPVQSKPNVDMSEWEQALMDSQQELMDTGLGIFTDQLISFEEAEVASLQNRLNNLRNFYDEQQILAGDNERAKQELRLREERETAALQKKIAQKEKEARRYSVIIDTAAGIVRAFATSPTIAQGIINAAIVAAQGASQLAIINRTQPRFKDGVIDLKGPGTGTSDSIQARLSRGESVMTAKETQNSMGILKDIRAKKLDDRVLKDLKLSASVVSLAGGMDDSRILEELQKIREGQPNIIEQSGKLYKQYNKGKSYKVKSRISAMGY